LSSVSLLLDATPSGELSSVSLLPGRYALQVSFPLSPCYLDATPSGELSSVSLLPGRYALQVSFPLSPCYLDATLFR
ncbi:hypothetical protein JZ751_014963, partial [Albula glossodonta]